MSKLNYDFFLRNINPGNSSYQIITNFSEEDHDYTTIAQAFLYARQYFSPKLFAFYGLHFLRFALTRDYSVEPRAGLRWLLTPEKSLSIAYGKHSRIENLQYYLARDHQSGGNEVQINRNLRFTRAHHVTVSYEQVLANAHKVKLETYYQQLYNAPVQTDPASIYTSINEDTGFVTDSLINNGNGKNYGIEASFERSFSNDLYYLANASVFQSTFSIPGQPEKNTSYNANYSVHFLAGKEFSLSNDRRRFGVNLKISAAGGKRYIPIDLVKSIAERRQVYQWDAAFDKQLPNYFRTDFQFVYRVNRKRHTVEWRLDIQNLTHHRNDAYFYYDVASESIRLIRQVGLVPLLSCRFEF